MTLFTVNVFYISNEIVFISSVVDHQHTHHLRAQVHLRLAGRESGAGRATQQHGLLGDTGGGGADALGPADELSCGRGGGQVDLRVEG